MRSGNPALNDKIFDRETRAAQAGAVGVDSGRRSTTPVPGRRHRLAVDADQASCRLPGHDHRRHRQRHRRPAGHPPDGWRDRLVAGQDHRRGGVVDPRLADHRALGALGVAILTIFKPKLARFTSPVYALLEGLVLGAISHVYEAQWNGIVVQAVGLTVAVLSILLFLYATRVIKVTDKLRTGIIAATGAVFVVYLIAIVLSLFGVNVGRS